MWRLTVQNSPGEALLTLLECWPAVLRVFQGGVVSHVSHGIAHAAVHLAFDARPQGEPFDVVLSGRL